MSEPSPCADRLLAEDFALLGIGWECPVLDDSNGFDHLRHVYVASLELQLNAALEELSIALEIESIEMAIPVPEIETHVV